MRIALNAWFIGQPTTGSGQYLAHLLAEYAARPAGHRVLLCGRTGQQSPDATNADPASFEWQNLHTPFDDGLSSVARRPSSVIRRSLSVAPRPSSNLKRHLAKLWFEQVGFPRACRRWGADLAHTPYWASPLFSRTPTVVTIHDLIPILLPAYGGGQLGRLYVRLVTLSARRAAHVLTDSHASRRDIVARLHVPASRVEAIHLAAGDHFQPVNDPQALDQARDKYALPPRYLLYLGGFDVRKNVQSILRAYARLGLANVHLVIAGKLPADDTAFTPHPQRIADELGISERVCLTGWVDEEDKPALYSRAIALVFPSRYEGFGLPPLEAMSCGTPAIVSDRSSLPEIVGEGGICVDPDDLDALSQAMRRLATDTALHDSLRAAALSQSARFSWRNTAQATLAAYERSRPQVGRANRKNALKGDIP
jgi:glycosyltransferase involved in cell wall biosynthesis